MAPPARPSRRSLPHTALAWLAPAWLALACSSESDGGGGGGGGGGNSTDGTAVLVTLPASPPGSGLFLQRRFQSATSVTGLAAGDFDEDGDLDAAATGLDGDVWFHQNDGSGELRAKRRMRFDDPTSWPVAVDFDLDGDDDLVVLQRSKNRIRVMRSRGDGSFQTLAAVPTLASPAGLFSDDFDGDGLPDLLTHNQLNLAVHLNLGNGKFAQLVPGSLGTTEAYSAQLEDVDGDGVRDLVTAAPNVLIVRRSDGDGTFSPLMQSSGVFAGPLGLADVDGDGLLDALTGDCDQGVRWHRGLGTGGFVQGGVAPLDGCRSSTIAADLDGDGFDEVLACSKSELAVLRGSAGGPLDPALHPSGDSRGLAVADFDGDGLLDALVGHWTANELRLFHGNGDGTLDAPPYVELDANPVPSAGDLDGDGVVDLVSPVSNLLFGVGDGTFKPVAKLPGAMNGEASFVDVNLDSAVDLVASNVRVFLGNGMGGLGPAVVYSADYAPMAGVADLDGDFFPDVVAPLQTENEVAVFQNDGTGAFLPPLLYAAGAKPVDLALGDLDGNGLLDAVVCARDDDQLTLLFGAADGSFHSLASLAAGESPNDLALADLNGDGDLDLTVACEGNAATPGGIDIYMGRGDGSFDPPKRLGGTKPVQVVAADFDGDGILDLAAADGLVLLFLGKGAGKFHPPASFVVGEPSVRSLEPADYDGDGRLDLAAGNQDLKLTVLLNTGTAP